MSPGANRRTREPTAGTGRTAASGRSVFQSDRSPRLAWWTEASQDGGSSGWTEKNERHGRPCIKRTHLHVDTVRQLHLGRAIQMTDESASQPPPKVVKVFGKTGSPQCFAIRDFLYRNDVPFEWIELRTDEDVRAA